MADTVRERFEAYFSNGGDWPQAIERNRYDGSYKLAGAESAWNTWQAAYQQGQEDMRERAAKACEQQERDSTGIRTDMLVCAAAIRSLPTDGAA